MEKLFSEILGTPIITEDSSRAVGRVFNILVHPDKGHVVALALDFNFRRVIVPVDIRGWFREIIIPDSDAIIDSTDVLRVKEVLDGKRFFLKNAVYTKDGKYLGKIFDYAINIEQMYMTKIFVGHTFLGMVRFDQRIFSFQNILEVKEDRVIVKEDLRGLKVVSRELELAGS